MDDKVSADVGVALGALGFGGPLSLSFLCMMVCCALTAWSLVPPVPPVPCHAVTVTAQDLCGGIPVPPILQEGDAAGSFAFLEKELRFAAPAAPAGG
jgi:hypothetical protein